MCQTHFENLPVTVLTRLSATWDMPEPLSHMSSALEETWRAVGQVRASDG